MQSRQLSGWLLDMPLRAHWHSGLHVLFYIICVTRPVMRNIQLSTETHGFQVGEYSCIIVIHAWPTQLPQHQSPLSRWLLLLQHKPFRTSRMSSLMLLSPKPKFARRSQSLNPRSDSKLSKSVSRNPVVERAFPAAKRSGARIKDTEDRDVVGVYSRRK